MVTGTVSIIFILTKKTEILYILPEPNKVWFVFLQKVLILADLSLISEFWLWYIRNRKNFSASLKLFYSLAFIVRIYLTWFRIRPNHLSYQKIVFRKLKNLINEFCFCSMFFQRTYLNVFLHLRVSIDFWKENQFLLVT